MKRRTLIIGLAIVAAMSVAVPAMGQSAAPSAVSKVMKLVKKADQRSKRASKDARKALKLAKQGPTGPQGPAGPQGTTGLQGLQGPTGLSGLERITDSGGTNSDSGKVVGIACPSGKRLVSAGAEIIGGQTGVSTDRISHVVLNGIIPNQQLTGVTISAFESSATDEDWHINGYAICAKVEQ
jgi:hypothetical protein